MATVTSKVASDAPLQISFYRLAERLQLLVSKCLLYIMLHISSTDEWISPVVGSFSSTHPPGLVISQKEASVCFVVCIRGLNVLDIYRGLPELLCAEKLGPRTQMLSLIG